MTDARLDRYSFMDDEEETSVELSVEQYNRWVKAGRPISFFAAPEELKASYEIERLQKMSASYQKRHGWPSDGI